jgi:putative membrane protein
MFLVVWIISAVHPAIPEDWLLENVLVFVLAVLLAATYHSLPLSDLSYLLIFIFLCLHECGAHYQYSDAIPGEWMRPLLHSERNHFDRLVHFCFGLMLSYPQREVLMRTVGVRGPWLQFLPIFTVTALSAMYEMIEAVVANIVDPTDATAFLGSQGDPWDSQEDMFMAFVGVVLAMAILSLAHRRRWRPT